MGKDIFVCYARRDEQVAWRLVRNLQGQGVSCWVDTTDLRAGEPWRTKVREAIRDCRFFLCFLSRQAIESSGFRHNEILRAIEFALSLPPSEVFILPILRLNPCEVPYQELEEIHTVDMFPNWELGVSSIVRTVEYYRTPKGALTVTNKQEIVGARAEGKDRPDPQADRPYERFVSDTYRAYLHAIRRDSSLKHVCQQAGMVYRDIHARNCEMGRSQPDEYDHALAFYIAGWIIDHVDNFAVQGMEQEQLAGAITDQTLAYLHSQSRPEDICPE